MEGTSVYKRRNSNADAITHQPAIKHGRGRSTSRKFKLNHDPQIRPATRPSGSSPPAVKAGRQSVWQSDAGNWPDIDSRHACINSLFGPRPRPSRPIAVRTIQKARQRVRSRVVRNCATLSCASPTGRRALERHHRAGIPLPGLRACVGWRLRLPLSVHNARARSRRCRVRAPTRSSPACRRTSSAKFAQSGTGRP